MISPSPAEARDAALRVDRIRDPAAVVDDLRAVVRVLTRGVDAIGNAPHGAALTSIETSIEGCRRLAQQLRLAASIQPK
jgi:hypothetical protein